MEDKISIPFQLCCFLYSAYNGCGRTRHATPPNQSVDLVSWMSGVFSNKTIARSAASKVLDTRQIMLTSNVLPLLSIKMKVLAPLQQLQRSRALNFRSDAG